MDIYIFTSQVLVLLFMLLGMLLGEQIAGWMFGKLKGGIRFVIYFLLFVIFLVAMNYVPHLLGIPILGLLNSIMLFFLLGFSSVFLSRGILHVADSIFDLTRKKSPEEVNINVKGLIRYLSEKGITREDVKDILLNTFEFSGKKADELINGKIRKKYNSILNTEKFTKYLIEKRIDDEIIIGVFIKFAKMSPEKAIMVWTNGHY